MMSYGKRFRTRDMDVLAATGSHPSLLDGQFALESIYVKYEDAREFRQTIHRGLACPLNWREQIYSVLSKGSSLTLRMSNENGRPIRDFCSAVSDISQAEPSITLIERLLNDVNPTLALCPACAGPQLYVRCH